MKTPLRSISPQRPRRVEPQEWPVLLISSGFAFGAVALAIFIRTWSDTLFLTYFKASQIPLFYIGSALLFAPTTMGYAWLSQRFNPIRLNTSTLLLFSAISLLCLQSLPSNVMLFGLLLIMSLISPLVNAICWGLILERLNSRQSKRLIPLISSSATIGAAVSGTLGAEVIEWGGNSALMSLICLTLLALTPLPTLLVEKSTLDKITKQITERDRPPKLFDGLKALGRNRLLKVSAIATFLMAIATNLIDYLFKVKLQASLPPEELGPFFARFHAFTNLAILGVQMIVLSPALQRLGLRGSFALYPSSILALGMMCMAPVGLWALTALRGIDTLMKFTFYSTTENLLLTPVPFMERTQSKVFLKGAIYPLGGLVAGILITVIGQFTHPFLGVLIFTCVITAIWVWSTTRVHIHYIEQLSQNLSIDLTYTQGDRTLRARARRELAQQINAWKMESPNAHQRADLNTLITIISSSLDARHLSDHFLGLWYDSSLSVRADFIEWVDQMMRREHIKGVGALLEHYIHHEHTSTEEISAESTSTSTSSPTEQTPEQTIENSSEQTIEKSQD